MNVIPRSPRHHASTGRRSEFALAIPLFAWRFSACWSREACLHELGPVGGRSRRRSARRDRGWMDRRPGRRLRDRRGFDRLRQPWRTRSPDERRGLQEPLVDAVNRMTVGVGPLSAVHVSCNHGTGSDPPRPTPHGPTPPSEAMGATTMQATRSAHQGTPVSPSRIPTTRSPDHQLDHRACVPEWLGLDGHQLGRPDRWKTAEAGGSVDSSCRCSPWH